MSWRFFHQPIVKLGILRSVSVRDCDAVSRDSKEMLTYGTLLVLEFVLAYGRRSQLIVYQLKFEFPTGLMVLDFFLALADFFCCPAVFYICS